MPALNGLNDRLWGALDAIHLSCFFDRHNLPPALLPAILIAAAVLLLTALTLSQAPAPGGQPGGLQRALNGSDVGVSLGARLPLGNYTVKVYAKNGTLIGSGTGNPSDTVTIRGVTDSPVTVAVTDPENNVWTTGPMDVAQGGTAQECAQGSECDDENPCTNNTCPLGMCVFTHNDTNNCDDGQFCTVNDRCSQGVCGSSPRSCDDNDSSTADTCSEATDKCIHTNVTECAKDSDCDDDNACTNNTCQSGTCAFAPRSASCDDGLFCTTSEYCSAGECIGIPNTCDGNPSAEDRCSEAADACLYGNAPECAGSSGCNDGNACTIDSCVSGTCVFTNNDTNTCDDRQFCTVNDRCLSGACKGYSKNCDDGQPTTADTCSESTDKCIHTPIVECAQGSECDDENECTRNICFSGTCVFISDDANTCDDGQFCTAGDSCSSGFCSGSPRSCDDGKPTTVDHCSEATDACINTFGIAINFPDDFNTGDIDYAQSCAGGDFNQDGVLDNEDLPYLTSILESIQSAGVYTGNLQKECADIDRDQKITQEDGDCFSMLSTGAYGSRSQCPPCSQDSSAEICNDGADNNCDGQRDRETYDNAAQVGYGSDLCSCSSATPCSMLYDLDGIPGTAGEESVKRCSSISSLNSGAYRWYGEGEWKCNAEKSGSTLACGGRAYTCSMLSGTWAWSDSAGQAYPGGEAVLQVSGPCNRNGKCEGMETKYMCPSDCATFRYGVFDVIESNAAIYGWDFIQQTDSIVKLKPQLFRFSVRYSSCLSSPTQINYAGCAMAKAIVQRLHREGIMVLSEIHIQWQNEVTGAGTGRIPRRNLAAGSAYVNFLDNYENAVYTMASFFPEIDYWEEAPAEWNADAFPLAPDGSYFSLSEKEAITTDLMYRQHRAIARANPDAFVFMPCYHIMVNSPVFIDQLYHNINSGSWPSTNPRDYFDGVCLHPYWSSSNLGASWVSKITDVYNTVKQHGDDGIPMAWTEFGPYSLSMSPEEHAAFMDSAFTLANQNFPWLWGVTWYRAFDEPTGDDAGVMDGGDGNYAWEPAAYKFLTYSTNYASTFGDFIAPLSSAPVSGDYDGDGKSDFAVYAVNGDWDIRKVSGSAILQLFYGFHGGLPVSGDYDGDGKSDLAVYDEDTGYWFIYSPAQDRNLAWWTQYGGSGMAPVPGDYDGDGKSDLTVYNGATGNWYAYSLSSGNNILWAEHFGTMGMIPVSGDYDGDGKSDLSLYDGSTGKWYVYSPLTGSNIVWGKLHGGSGMAPVPGDYDGDGKSDLTVYDEATGNWYVITVDNRVLFWAKKHGGPGEVPIPGDYNGDGRSDMAVYQLSTGQWSISYSPAP